MSSSRAANETQATVPLNPRWKLVAGFTLTYWACAFPAALHYSTEFVIYAVEIVLLACMVGYVHTNYRLHLGSLWCMSFWGLFHLSGGLVHVPESWNTAGSNVLYNLWLIPGLLKYDQAVHFYGFAITTWVSWQILSQVTAAPRPTLILLAISVAASLGLGSLNEVVEFLASVTLPETNVGDYANYGWDLVSNALGAILAAIIIFFFGRTSDADAPDQKS